MEFREILAMAMQSLGANKLRSGLTMVGITIGVFSVISVMTAIGALQTSIESGISFLGSNIFQFAKYPVSGGQGGRNANKYENRRNITYAQAIRYQQLMEGIARTFVFPALTAFPDRSNLLIEAPAEGRAAALSLLQGAMLRLLTGKSSLCRIGPGTLTFQEKQ